MESKEIKNIIECILFVSDKPVSLGTFQGLFEDVERREVLACIDELKAEYDTEQRAFHLIEIAEGYQLATRVQYAPWIRKMFKSRTTNKLSRAALETLAIIAYRQPITKAEIEDIRGVSADGVTNALLERKFIRMVGRKEVIGRPMLYGTTKEFLHYFGLKDLTDMPELKELQDLLKEDDVGKDWELNQHGDLIARTGVDEDDESAGSSETETSGESGEVDEAGDKKEVEAETVNNTEENSEEADATEEASVDETSPDEDSDDENSAAEEAGADETSLDEDGDDEDSDDEDSDDEDSDDEDGDDEDSDDEDSDDEDSDDEDSDDEDSDDEDSDDEDSDDEDSDDETKEHQSTEESVENPS